MPQPDAANSWRVTPGIDGVSLHLSTMCVPRSHSQFLRIQPMRHQEDWVGKPVVQACFSEILRCDVSANAWKLLAQALAMSESLSCPGKTNPCPTKLAIVALGHSGSALGVCR